MKKRIHVQIISSIVYSVALGDFAIADTSLVEPTSQVNHDIASQKLNTSRSRIAICPVGTTGPIYYLSDQETKNMQDKLAAWEKKNEL